MIDRKLLKVINFILLIIRILNVFYFETASRYLRNLYATKLYSLPEIIADDLFCQVISRQVRRTLPTEHIPLRLVKCTPKVGQKEEKDEIHNKRKIIHHQEIP